MSDAAFRKLCGLLGLPELGYVFPKVAPKAELENVDSLVKC